MQSVRLVDAGVVAYESRLRVDARRRIGRVLLDGCASAANQVGRVRGRSELLGSATRSLDLRGRRGFLGVGRTERVLSRKWCVRFRRRLV
jgi:hypothetical protein